MQRLENEILHDMVCLAKLFMPSNCLCLQPPPKRNRRARAHIAMLVNYGWRGGYEAEQVLETTYCDAGVVKRDGKGSTSEVRHGPARCERRSTTAVDWPDPIIQNTLEHKDPIKSTIN